MRGNLRISLWVRLCTLKGLNALLTRCPLTHGAHFNAARHRSSMKFDILDSVQMTLRLAKTMTMNAVTLDTIQNSTYRNIIDFSTPTCLFLMEFLGFLAQKWIPAQFRTEHPKQLIRVIVIHINFSQFIICWCC